MKLSVPLLEHEPQRLRWSRSAIRAYADAERERLRLCEQRDAGGRLAPALRLGQGQPLEPELRRRGVRQLTFEPGRVVLDRGQDLRFGGAGSHRELGRLAGAER